MKRLAIPLLAGPALVAALLAANGSTAAFVDSAETPGNAGADSIERWLALEPAGSASCVPTAALLNATGADRSLALATGGLAARTPGGLVLDCALVLRARDTFPEGAGRITVGVAADGAAGSPVTAAALTSGGSGAGSDTATLAPGESRIVRLTVRDTAVDRGTLLVTANVGEESSGFLRYDVPVDVCAGAMAAACVAAGGGGTPGTGDTGDGDRADAGTTSKPGGTTAQGPDVPQQPGTGSADSQSPARPPVCVSNRRFVIHLPRLRRRERIRRATVTVAGKRTHVTIGRWRRRGAARIDLRGMPRRTVTVKVFVRATSGRLVKQTRRYRTCTPGAARKLP